MPKIFQLAFVWFGLTGIFVLVLVLIALIIDPFTPFEPFQRTVCSPAYRECLYGSGPIVGWALWVSPCLSLAVTGFIGGLEAGYRRRTIALVLVPVVPGLLTIGYVVTTLLFTPGEQIAFASNRDGDIEVFVMDTDGNNITGLKKSYPGKSSWGFPEAESSLAWSPDGKQIAYPTSLGIQVLASDGYDQRTVTSHYLGRDFSPSWSPDGNRIAFTRILRDRSADIYVIDTNRTTPYPFGLRRLTTHAAEDVGPSWSPDGTRIAFASARSGTWDIYLMDASGGNVLRLSTHPRTDYSHSPSWSPDGNRIAFVGSRENDRNIYVMNSDGTKIQRLTTHPAADVGPSWSPDGKRIAFASKREGNWDIYVIDANGGNIQRLTHSPWKDFSPEWSSASDPSHTLIARG